MFEIDRGIGMNRMEEEVKQIVEHLMEQWDPRKITLEKALTLMNAVEEKENQTGAR
jgi:topoisomerase IA-like protein